MLSGLLIPSSGLCGQLDCRLRILNFFFPPLLCPVPCSQQRSVTHQTGSTSILESDSSCSCSLGKMGHLGLFLRPQNHSHCASLEDLPLPHDWTALLIIFLQPLCLDLASAQGPIPVFPLDGASAIGHKKAPRCRQTPAPAADRGCSQPWGLPVTPSRSVPLGADGHNPPCVTHPGVCARYLWSIIPLLCGTEGMRNPYPAVPGISVLGRARPGSARGRCWQSAAEGGGEGTDLGVTLCLAAAGLFPFTLGVKRAGWRNRDAIIVFC